jgi:hypothetical protein
MTCGWSRRAAPARAAKVSDALVALDPKMHDLGSSQAGEHAYSRWVTQSILALEPFAQRDDLERVCHGVPALAAFAVFLYRHHRTRFDVQFGALLGLDDFDKWASHRIDMLVAPLANRRTSERMLARIALSLPLPRDRVVAMSAANASLVDALMLDRWIEIEQDCYIAAHDVLADALAARWLFEAGHAATPHATELLEEAAAQGELASALIALERLAWHPKFGEIDGTAVVEALIARHGDQVRRSCGLLLGGSLLNLDQKLMLLDRSELIRTAVGSPVFDSVLGHVAALVAVQKSTETPPGIRILCDLLDDACARSQSSNFVLRRAYALDPARFRDRALASLAAFPSAEPTHFLLAQMLRSGEPVEVLDEAVKRWLDSNASAWRASFVYDAWLDAGGGVEAVSEALLAWVGKHGRTLEAQFVYYAWVQAGGGLAAVSGALLAWVGEHGRAPEASYAYQAWVQAGGGLAAVSEALLAWLGEHGQMQKAQYVYKAWLDAGGEVEAVSAALVAWVREHGQTQGTQYVYKAWLDAGGEVEAVSAALVAWVREHGQTQAAAYVYKAWLDAGGEVEAVSAALVAWVREHGQTQAAAYVYKAWLDAGGEVEAVSATLVAWVGEHGQTQGAQFLYRAWLNREADFEAIRDQLFAWVVLWHGERQAVFVTRHLCKRHDLPEEVIVAIARWSATYFDHEDSLDRLANLLDHVHEETLSDAGFVKLIRLTEDAIVARLAHGHLPDFERSRLWAISASLAKGVLFCANPQGCLRIIATLIRSGRVFTRKVQLSGIEFLQHTYDRMLNAALNAVQWGELSTDRDAEALAQFVDWLRAGDPQIEGWERLLAKGP